MSRTSRRSGVSLLLIGILGVAFFWMTDPRYGLALRWSNGEISPVDLANQHFYGTVLGVAGSALVFLVGMFLISRRAI